MTTSRMNRRDFLTNGARLGLSATALAALVKLWGGDPTQASAASGHPPKLLTSAVPRREWPAQEIASEPQYDYTSTQTKIGHLMRRAGFGANAKEIRHFSDLGVEKTVDHLLDYEMVDDSALEIKLAELDWDLETFQGLRSWWFARMVYTKRPLQEKMVLFWHGLLTSEIRKVGRGPMMYEQNELYRRNALGSYDSFLKDVIRDPAMLIYLDNRSSRKESPNENFSRELLELFTLGVGNYGEHDVRESARAFTGYSLQRRGRTNLQEFVFRSRWHDWDRKEFMGEVGDFDGDQIVDIIVKQPSAAQFITQRLFSYFAYDDPDLSTIDRIAQVFVDSHYNVKELVRAILTSPEFYSNLAYRSKVKSPIELIVSTYRLLDIDTDGRSLQYLAQSMGQTAFDPPSVEGWTGGVAWINSTTLINRVNFANQISAQYKGRIRNALRSANRSDLTEHFIALLLDGNLSQEERLALNEFIQDVESLGSPIGSARQRDWDAELLKGLLYLITASPAYQLA